MKILHDMHTHTIFSGKHHAKNTMEEMVNEARAQGMKAITISDHGHGHMFYGIDEKKLPEMRAEIDRLNEKYDDIDIKLGVEANLIGADGTCDIGEEELKYCDVIYLGYHYGFAPDTPKNFFDFMLPNAPARFIPPLQQALVEKNTEAYLKAMDRYPIKMITHPGDKMPVNIDKIAKKAEEKGIILEINAHHDHLSAEELKIAGAYDIEFAVNSDAHATSQLGRTGNALENIIASGIDPARVINVEYEPGDLD